MIHPEMNVIYLIAVLSLVFFTVCVCGVCLCLCSNDKPTNVRHQRRANHTNTTNNDHSQYPATIFDHSCHPIIINNFLHYPDMNYDVKPFNNFETPPPSYLEVTGGYNQDSSRHTHHNCDSVVGSHNDGLHGPCSSRGDITRGTDGGGTCDTGDSGGCDTDRGDGGGCDTGGGDSGCCDSGGGDGGGCDSGGTD